MNDKPKTPAKPNPQLPQLPTPTNPRGIRPVYSNNLGLSATRTDFTLLFLETGQWPGADGAVTQNEISAIVTLPPAAAVGIIEALTQYLSTVEENDKQLKEAIDKVMRKDSAS